MLRQIKWLTPDGGWLQKSMELVMNICDLILGHGNWGFAQYGLWIILEGIVLPGKIYGQPRSLRTLQPITSKRYYQGNYAITVFQFRIYVIVLAINHMQGIH